MRWLDGITDSMDVSLSELREWVHAIWGFSSGSAVENPPASAEDRKLGWEDPLEKVMAAHAGILVWEIPWTEKPGRLQSMESQRVGHDLAIQQQYSY